MSSRETRKERLKGKPTAHLLEHLHQLQAELRLIKSQEHLGQRILIAQREKTLTKHKFRKHQFAYIVGKFRGRGYTFIQAVKKAKEEYDKLGER